MAEKDTEYLNSKEPFRDVRLIGGAYATVDTPAIVGFCHNEDHKGIITVTILNQHGCIAKGCHYFEKFEDYPFWARYERKINQTKIDAEKKCRRKENEERHQANIKSQEDKLISRAYQFASSLGFDTFRIISIRKNDEGYTIFYISDTPENDWYEFREIAFAMNKAFHKKFTLKHVKTPDGDYAVL